MTEMFIPRGVRNNNPLNIKRTADHWQGMARQQTDSTFVVFEHMRWGCRAAFKIMITYVTKYQCNTIEKIISRWCPDHTAPAYIRAVSESLGVPGSTVINPFDYASVIPLVEAMAWIETGWKVTVSEGYLRHVDFVDGFYLATGRKVPV